MTENRVIGLIAGSGEFPIEIAEAVISTGNRLFVLGLRGFFDRRLRAYPFTSIDMLDPQGAIDVLRRHDIKEIVFAGGVERPGPAALLSIYSAYQQRDELKRLLNSGDDTLLRGVMSIFENNGFRVLGVHDVASSCLAPLGQFGSVNVPKEIDSSLHHAVSLLTDIGRYDIGQGIVISGQRVLAIEGPEGTDAMLKRVQDMQKSKRVKLGDEQAILVKMAKPNQDRRVDLPAIGPKTIKAAKAAGLSGIIVAAGDVVLVERRKLIADADKNNLYLAGVKAR